MLDFTFKILPWSATLAEKLKTNKIKFVLSCPPSREIGFYVTTYRWIVKRRSRFST